MHFSCAYQTCTSNYWLHCHNARQPNMHTYGVNTTHTAAASNISSG